MSKQFINPKDLTNLGTYTHVVIAQSKKIIFISGQVALDASGQIVGSGDLRAQTRQVFENLKIALGAAGATFADVVKMNTYVVNYKPEMRPALVEVRSEYLPKENPPASTLVGVTALAREEFLIEIEAIAVV
ncbi:MAG: RidA family protein [Chloroflexi bacterium]|nr:RidA family protein [Chloroflexota bacterium]